MKKSTVEFSVGVFVLIGLVCVAYLTIKLGKLELTGDGYYRVNAKFASVAGLKEGAPVEMAGVEIGKVDRIHLDPKELVARVRLRIRDDVPLTDDVVASVRTSGLIGDKYIQLAPGGSDVRLKEGDTIVETESAVDLESILSKYAFGDVKTKEEPIP